MSEYETEMKYARAGITVTLAELEHRLGKSKTVDDVAEWVAQAKGKEGMLLLANLAARHVDADHPATSLMELAVELRGDGRVVYALALEGIATKLLGG